MSSSRCTDNVTLNDLILNNPSLSDQGSNHMIKCNMCKPSTTSGIIKVIIVLTVVVYDHHLDELDLVA